MNRVLRSASLEPWAETKTVELRLSSRSQAIAYIPS